MSSPTPSTPTLHTQRHTKYWLRCLKTCLPKNYTSTDLNRITLSFFTLASLDLLGTLTTHTTPAEREAWISWIYYNQLHTGGFRGSPATNFGENEQGHVWDPPNIPASYFALAALLTLGDDLSRVKKRELLGILPSVQRADGSFGEWVMMDGEVVGGSDMRFVYCACAIRWILRGEGKGMEGVPDFDVEGCVGFIKSAETYDHGISDKPYGEAHAGLTYCALGALSLLGRLQDGISSADNLAKWLTARQVPLEVGDLRDEEDDEGGVVTGGKVELDRDGKMAWAGFNGRCNKRGDTCYSYWVGGSLDLLGKLDLIHKLANRSFLLDQTQHFIGGFAKLPVPGTPPDIMHSFLGLAALALMGEEGLEPLDSALCISLKAKERLVGMDWWRGVSS